MFPHGEQGPLPVAPTIAFGPEMPDWGSWRWVGSDLAGELLGSYQTAFFSGDEVQPSAAVVVVKHMLSPTVWQQLAARSGLIYCPVDFYGDSSQVEADAGMLRLCSRVVVHCERLGRYFEPYVRVEYMDHHVKFVAPMPRTPSRRSHVLWAGVRTNLPPLVAWINAHPLPADLVVLTNPETPGVVPGPTEFGFRADRVVRTMEWSPERHLEMARTARAALDIKGQDFRARHKPPAKAIDFIASGLPLAMNRDSSPVEHLARMGFEVADPLDAERWFSRDYWEETRRFGRAIRELLSLERIGRRFKRIIDEVLAERGERPRV